MILLIYRGRRFWLLLAWKIWSAAYTKRWERREPHQRWRHEKGQRFRGCLSLISPDVYATYLTLFAEGLAAWRKMPFISQPIKGFLSHTGVPQIIQKSTILVLTYILKAMGRGTSVLRRLQMSLNCTRHGYCWDLSHSHEHVLLVTLHISPWLVTLCWTVLDPFIFGKLQWISFPIMFEWMKDHPRRICCWHLLTQSDFTIPGYFGVL